MYIEEIKKYIGKQFTIASSSSKTCYKINKIITSIDVEITWGHEGYLNYTVYDIPSVLKYIDTNKWLIINDIKDIEDD